MIRGLLLLLAVSFGQRISRAEELPVKIGGGSGEEVEVAGVSGGILTVETRLPGEQMLVRQMSNSQDLMILVYVRKGQLVACEKFQGPTAELNRFLNQHSNLISAVQQDQSGTKFKDTEEMEFTRPPIDWNRSWNECIRLQEAQREDISRLRRRRSAAERSPRSRRWTLVLPGTNWCGKGDASTENGSLYGENEAADRCCHQHDLCPRAIGPLAWNYNYFNHRLTTISHCDCETEFRRCLQTAGDTFSSTVGRIYFNSLRFKCFTLEPQEVCTDRAWYGLCRSYGQEPTAQIHEPTPF